MGADTPRIVPEIAFGSVCNNLRDQVWLVGIRFDPERTAEPIIQSPGRSCGARPPAIPKLTIPGQSRNVERASAITAVSLAPKRWPSPPQTTHIPGPAAMRASNASPTTIIKNPLSPITLRTNMIQCCPASEQASKFNNEPLPAWVNRFFHFGEVAIEAPHGKVTNTSLQCSPIEIVTKKAKKGIEETKATAGFELHTVFLCSSRNRAVTASHFHGRIEKSGGALNRQIRVIATPVQVGVKHEFRSVEYGEVASEETTYRACLMLVLSQLVGMGEDICRRVISAVWPRCSGWTC
jgi:hypothetical protein